MQSLNSVEHLSEYLRALTKGMCSKSISDKFMDSPYREHFSRYVDEDCKKEEQFLREKISDWLISTFGWDKNQSKKGPYFYRLLHHGKEQCNNMGLNNIANDIACLQKSLLSQCVYQASAISKCVEFLYPQDKEPSHYVDFIILKEMQKRMPKFMKAELKEISNILISNMDCRKQHFFEGMQKKYRQNLANQEKILERVVVKMYENTNIKCSFDRDG